MLSREIRNFLGLTFDVYFTKVRVMIIVLHSLPMYGSCVSWVRSYLSLALFQDLAAQVHANVPSIPLYHIHLMSPLHHQIYHSSL